MVYHAIREGNGSSVCTYAQEQEIAGHWRSEEDLRYANAQLREEAVRDRLAVIVDSSDDAIISNTRDGIITSWNQGAQKIFGYSHSEAMGRPIAMLFPADRVSEGTEIRSRLRRGESMARPWPWRSRPCNRKRQLYC